LFKRTTTLPNSYILIAVMRPCSPAIIRLFPPTTFQALPSSGLLTQEKHINVSDSNHSRLDQRSVRSDTFRVWW